MENNTLTLIREGQLQKAAQMRDFAQAMTKYIQEHLKPCSNNLPVFKQFGTYLIHAKGYPAQYSLYSENRETQIIETDSLTGFIKFIHLLITLNTKK